MQLCLQRDSWFIGLVERKTSNSLRSAANHCVPSRISSFPFLLLHFLELCHLSPKSTFEVKEAALGVSLLWFPNCPASKAAEIGAVSVGNEEEASFCWFDICPCPWTSVPDCNVGHYCQSIDSSQKTTGRNHRRVCSSQVKSEKLVS